jgi:hypothetical protein
LRGNAARTHSDGITRQTEDGLSFVDFFRDAVHGGRLIEMSAIRQLARLCGQTDPLPAYWLTRHASSGAHSVRVLRSGLRKKRKDRCWLAVSALLRKLQAKPRAGRHGAALDQWLAPTRRSAAGPKPRPHVSGPQKIAKPGSSAEPSISESRALPNGVAWIAVRCGRSGVRARR